MLVRRIVLVLLAAGLIATAPAVASSRPPVAPRAQVAKTCSSGYTHAVIGHAQKCLRRGEFCAHGADRQYRRYGFRCVRYYANVGRYRLT